MITMTTALFLIAAFTNHEGLSVQGAATLQNGKPAANCVVYLEGEEKSHPMAHAMVDQRDRTFIPHVSVITVGTEVQFPNHDTIFHNVFADYDAKRFDLGMYPRGASKHQTFPKRGVVAMMCSIHPDMSAYIMVVDTPYYAVTDSKGRFDIEGVRPGRYTVRGWHESGQVASTPVQLQQSEKLEISLHRGHD